MFVTDRISRHSTHAHSLGRNLDFMITIGFDDRSAPSLNGAMRDTNAFNIATFHFTSMLFIFRFHFLFRHDAFVFFRSRFSFLAEPHGFPSSGKKQNVLVTVL